MRNMKRQMGRGTSAVGGTLAEPKRRNWSQNQRKQDLGAELNRVLFLSFLPQVAFVGGILDVVADVVVHPMSCCAVASIKHLASKHKNKKTS